ncbi:unnamed protein product [Eruca vesicaria subsp. sativa]|uniref:Uncharacterized protein n=1 Tax=Eruca vesicaria subsp. sativa TaxID=29727 RepID=A0ABC8LU44_ERUVS|nr:unnamed protein product [Eruca vesicaria subsp. sativa]
MAQPNSRPLPIPTRLDAPHQNRSRFVDENKTLTLWESHDEKLELDEMKTIQGKRDKWLLFPRRTIRELLDSTQVHDLIYFMVAI